MEPQRIHEKIKRDQLVRIIHEGYYEVMVKCAVDVERGVLALGGEWHSDAEEVLVADGSQPDNVWGANFYPWKGPRERIVYTSLINIKPALSHRKMEVGDPLVRQRMHAIITRLLLNDDETLPTE